MKRIINITEMVNQLNLPNLTALEVNKRDIFVEIFEAAVNAHNQPRRDLVWEEAYKTIDAFPEWDPLELNDLMEYLLSYITEYKKHWFIPDDIKLKLVLILNNRVSCFGKLEMCAKTTHEIYQRELDALTQEAQDALLEEEADVIDYPTAEDLERINV